MVVMTGNHPGSLSPVILQVGSALSNCHGHPRIADVAAPGTKAPLCSTMKSQEEIALDGECPKI